ncbi:hypothetical protein F938_03625 [Acinetobacter bereziniae LMG 1003 = CIP 70.12]|uniref:Uncharacterized protein n=1 Tax=Acinetobacter bereziniae LMG 1003 = CIP 70.12 TaxID=981324 RepID=N9CZX2_ACIBZ|nr:hypothetical protein F938_03625 [Acinetobacter bereziniae LMG 1003 = CIP 70.12]
MSFNFKNAMFINVLASLFITTFVYLVGENQ